MAKYQNVILRGIQNALETEARNKDLIHMIETLKAKGEPQVMTQVLAVGGFGRGFRFYGPFPLELDDPASIEEAHMDERDYYEGSCHWIFLLDPIIK